MLVSHVAGRRVLVPSTEPGRLSFFTGPLIAGELRAIGFSPSEVFMAMLPAVALTVIGVFALTTFCKTHPEA